MPRIVFLPDENRIIERSLTSFPRHNLVSNFPIYSLDSEVSEPSCEGLFLGHRNVNFNVKEQDLEDSFYLIKLKFVYMVQILSSIIQEVAKHSEAEFSISLQLSDRFGSFGVTG